MTIQEIQLDGFNQSLKFNKLDYPQCACGNCPKMFFNLLSVGARQSGKTYSLVKLLKHYESHKLVKKEGSVHPLRFILISPTSEANPIYQSLNSLDSSDIYEEYSDEVLQGIIDDVKAKRAETDAFISFRLENLSTNTSAAYSSDSGSPILCSLIMNNYNSMFRDDFGIYLMPQSLTNITLSISDDYTNRLSGVATAVSFVLCLVVT